MRILSIVIGIVFLASITLVLMGKTLVFNISDYTPSIEKDLTIGDTINPLSQFNFSEGDWKAYIVISGNDYNDLHPEVTKATCLKTTDYKILNEMKANWSFIFKNADLATCTSSFYLFQNGKLMFESGIVLTKETQGLQNRQFGWIKPIERNGMIKALSKFNRVYWPVVFL